jgi:sirohydrochlorin cobaltochelatase
MSDHSKDTLVLLGHGAVKSPLAARPVHWHAEEIRRRQLFQEVLVGFWREDPSIRMAVSQIRTPRAFVVPLFLSEGYFTQQVIPRELDLPKNEDDTYQNRRVGLGTEIHYTLPVGTHPRMQEVVADTAARVVKEYPFPSAPQPEDLSLFLVGHGTPKNPNSRKAVEAHVQRIRHVGTYAQVESLHLEEEPGVARLFDLATQPNVVVVPFFLGDALHPMADVPIQLGEPESVVMERLAAGHAPWRNPTERQGKRIWYAQGLGMDPVVTEILLARVEESRLAAERAR